MANVKPILRTESQELSAGARKAAVFVLAVGDEIARELFTRLSEDEIRDLGDVARRLEDVSRAEVISVLEEFRQRFAGGHIPKKGVGSMFQLMMERALGEDRAHALFPQEETMDDPFDAVKTVDAGTLARLLEAEHAQTIAIVLDALSSDRAAKVLQKLDEARAPEIVWRLAHLGNVSDEVRRDVGKTFGAELLAMNLKTPDSDEENSEERTVGLVKALPTEFANNLLTLLEARDAEFAKDLKSKLFTFDDLVGLDSRSMQRLLRELDTKSLAIAMKGSSTGVSDLIFGSMSSRAAEMLKDDIDAMGPTRLADVEAAQKTVVEAAIRLETDGVITIPRGEGDVV
jgi:flagellar motor switch protein FliG